LIGCTIASVLLAGCASVPRQDARFSLATIDAAVEPVQIVDRTKKSGFAEPANPRRLAATLDPPIVQVLARRLAAADLQSIKGQAVTVHKADTEAYVVSNRQTNRPPMHIIVGAPLAANVLGNLIGHGIVSLFGPSDELVFLTTVEISVNGESYRVTGAAQGLPDKAEQLVSNAVNSAVLSLISQLRSVPNIDTTPISVPPGAPPE
jgi:hypothetical protein